MTNGIFGDLFDFDQNGELDVIEAAMEFQLLQELLENIVEM